MGKFNHLFGIDLNCDGEIDDLERIMTYNLIMGDKVKKDEKEEEYFGGSLSEMPPNFISSSDDDIFGE